MPCSRVVGGTGLPMDAARRRESSIRSCSTECMIREELSRLFTFEERHRRLLARMMLAALLSLTVFVVGTALVWLTESGKQGSEIHGFGDAAFFTAVQLLTVSSSLPNPVTVAGKVVDVALEAWGIFVITAVAGSFATFFSSGDS
jgi:hypothetical protein